MLRYDPGCLPGDSRKHWEAAGRTDPHSALLLMGCIGQHPSQAAAAGIFLILHSEVLAAEHCHF